MSDTLLKRLSIALGIIGLVDSAYLTWVKFSHSEAICGLGNCSEVNSSSYSEIAGVPIALLGFGAYLVILVIHWMEGQKNWIGDNALMLIFGLTLVGTLYSLYLTAIEIWVLRAICPYCVTSAVAITIMLVIAIVRVMRDA